MDHTVDIASEYEKSLEAYIDIQQEKTLVEAGSLGRRAISFELGVLDMVVMHHDSVAHITERRRDLLTGTGELFSIAATFFCEALSPFEMTHTGFQDAVQTLAGIVQFGSVVCHELRTPLTSAISSIGMLQDISRAEPGGLQANLLKNIADSIAILKKRTDDLYEIVGLQSGKLSIRPVTIDPIELIEGVMERMRQQAEGAGVELSFDHQGSLPQVQLDPNRIGQVIENLIQNGLKYAAEGRKVDVRAGIQGSSLVIEVRDYGEGISLWDRMKIFEPNFRGKREDEDVPGLGLGLTLCKELVNAHRGAIYLRDTKGKGALFHIELPLS